MKRILIIIMLFTLLLSANATDVKPTYETSYVNNSELTLSNGIDAYDNIYVEIPSQIYLRKTTNRFDIKIDSEDSILTKMINYEIKDKTLRIYIKNFHDYELLSFDPSKIKIILYSPNDVNIKTSKSLQIEKRQIQKHDLVSYGKQN